VLHCGLHRRAAELVDLIQRLNANGVLRCTIPGITEPQEEEE
jgi:hypothetical protein